MSAPVGWRFDREWYELRVWQGRQCREMCAAPRFFSSRQEAVDAHRRDSSLSWAEPHMVEPSLSEVRAVSAVRSVS